MKQHHRKPDKRTRTLQVQDLAAVRGGDNGVIHLDVIVGGGVSPHDDGVVHSRN